MIAPMAERAGRRGVVTPEHKQEADSLKKIWLREKPRLEAAGWGSQDAFGAKFNIGNQAAVGHFLNGNTALSFKAASGFAKGLRCQISDFSPRLAAMVVDPFMPDAGEQAAMYVMLLALINSHPNAAALLSTFDGIAVGLRTSAGSALSQSTETALERFRSQLTRRVASAQQTIQP